MTKRQCLGTLLYEQNNSEKPKGETTEKTPETPASRNLAELRKYVPNAEIGKDFEYTDLSGNKDKAQLKTDGTIRDGGSYLEFGFFLNRFFIKPAQEKLAETRRAAEEARFKEEQERLAPIRAAEEQAAKLAAEEEARQASIAEAEARFPERKGPQEGVESHFNAVFDQYFNQLDKSLVGYTYQVTSMKTFGSDQINGRQYNNPNTGVTVTAFEASKDGMFVIAKKAGVAEQLQIYIGKDGNISNSITSSFGREIVPANITTQAQKEQYYVNKINQGKINEKILSGQRTVSDIIQTFLKQYS